MSSYSKESLECNSSHIKAIEAIVLLTPTPTTRVMKPSRSKANVLSLKYSGKYTHALNKEA